MELAGIGNGAKLRDNLSQSSENKMRLRDKTTHKRMKRQIHLGTAIFRIRCQTVPIVRTGFF